MSLPTHPLHKPEPGDPFYPLFEQDLLVEREKSRPNYRGKRVCEVSDDTIIVAKEVVGFSVCCDDGVWYECFWSAEAKAWVYGLGNGYNQP